MGGIRGASERDRTSDLLITNQQSRYFNLLIIKNIQIEAPIDCAQTVQQNLDTYAEPPWRGQVTPREDSCGGQAARTGGPNAEKRSADYFLSMG